MRPSTKHAILQRLVGVIGLVLVMVPNWVSLPYIRENFVWIILLGFVLGFVGGFSALGLGPWGRRFTKLYVNENRADIGRPPLQ